MAEPTVIPRSEHSISRRKIDPDALKVLYRLRQFDHAAYLVGGGVRDLLLGRHPKDFDIGTSAHPHQIKRLFRNCWIIGRRFRLALVKFGPKTIEVATFRRHVTPGSERDPEPVQGGSESGHHRRGQTAGSGLLHRDNTFGTPEEDAFRRDFTINALFYDVSNFSIIDYVDGLRDLQARLIRCIGDPEMRFLEDPVRMVRAVALAARLDFQIERPILDAIKKHRTAITDSAPARMMEELYKILRSGASERTYRGLADIGLLDHISPEMSRRRSDVLWRSLRALDAYRARFSETPESLTNPILLGSLLVPAGLLTPRSREARDRQAAPRITLGALPLARGHVDRLRQIVGLQHRLVEPNLPDGAQRALQHRSVFEEALTWLEIHGDAPDALQRWRALPAGDGTATTADQDRRPGRRWRRRRRGRARRPPG